MKKKIISLILAFVMALATCVGSLISPIHVYASEEPRITVETVKGVPGETVDVTVSIANNPGILSMIFLVSHSDELSFVNATNVSEWNSFTEINPNQHPLRVYYDISFSENDYYEGEVFVLTFKVAEDAEAGTYNIKVACDSGNTFNATGQPVSFALGNGGVTIEEIECSHLFSDYISDGNATCTSDGTKTAICDNGCGETDEQIDIGSALNHSFTNYVYQDDATYEVNGTEIAACDHGCGQTLTREKVNSKLVDSEAPTGKITVKEISWKEFLNIITFGIFFNDKFDVVVEAADSESGVNTVEYYLSESEVTDITTVTEWMTYETFSITDEGQYVVYVKVTDKQGNVTYVSTDGLVIDRTLPLVEGIVDGAGYCEDTTFYADDRNLDSIAVNGIEIELNNDEYTLEGTTEGTEYVVVVTDKAGNKTTTTIKVFKGHSFEGNYVSNNDASCTANGTETATCDRGCGEIHTQEDVDSMLPHEFTNYISNSNATCTTNATETATCKFGCGEEDVRDMEGTQLDHVYTIYVSDENATCQTDGTKTATCDLCQIEKDTVADAGTKTTHVFETYVADENATCQVGGTKTAECKFGCGATDIVEGDSIVDHKYTNYISNNNATCKANGTETAVCDYGCGNTDTREDIESRLAHMVANWTVTKEPTTKDFGEKAGLCSLCDETVTEQVDELDDAAEEEQSNDKSEVNDSTPDTGDVNNMWKYVVLLLVSALMFVVYSNIKFRREE